MTGVSAIMASLGGAFVNPALPFDFSAPPQLVSASFNGTSQYLSASNAAFTFTGDFTVEGWYRPTSVTGLRTLFTLGTSTFASGSYVLYSSAGAFQGQLFGGSATSFSAGTMSINTWYHIALVRSGSTITLYVNGTAGSGTSTQAGTIGNGAVTIGFMAGGYGYFAGQISNFRVAASAVYPGNFTTPTRPLSLTGATFFAALGVTAFVDSSSNAISITNTGTVALTDQSPFPATWTDSVSGIVATVAGAAQFGNNNPTYDPRFGGGLMFGESPRQTYVDVPTARGVGGGFTISIAAQIPGQPQNHYNAIICGNVVSRSGRYVMSRYWQGDGLEFGHIENWVAVNMGSPTSIPLSWYDYVYNANGTTVTLYRNGAQIGTGTVSGTVLGWLNPLRFGGDESITGVNANTMATGVLYRMIHTKSALSAGEVTTQFNAVRSTYGL
jgi:hypothetical protein